MTIEQGAPTAIIDSAVGPSHHSAKMPEPCTFSRGEWKTLSGFWYPVAWSADVADEPVGATLLDEDLVIYRTSGGVVVARDLCLHRGSRLRSGGSTRMSLSAGIPGGDTARKGGVRGSLPSLRTARSHRARGCSPTRRSNATA